MTKLKYILPALLASLALPTSAADYQIDPSHTYANFEIDHMGFSTQRGLFRHTSGQIRFDPEARSGEIEIRIDAASLDTGFGLRDDVLRGADWFNVRITPTSSFAANTLSSMTTSQSPSRASWCCSAKSGRYDWKSPASNAASIWRLASAAAVPMRKERYTARNLAC